jgi:hypothetical protein
LDEAKIKKLAAVLFDSAAKEGERTNAVAKITSLAGKDRDQLAEELVSGLKGDASKNRFADDGGEWRRRFREKDFEVSNLNFQISQLNLQVSMLNLQISTLTAQERSALASRDYFKADLERVMAERDRVVCTLKAELERMKAERRREQQRPANLPEVKCAAPGCSNVFRPNRRDHRTCSDRCRRALSRAQASIQ